MHIFNAYPWYINRSAGVLTILGHLELRAQTISQSKTFISLPIKLHIAL